MSSWLWLIINPTTQPKETVMATMLGVQAGAQFVNAGLPGRDEQAEDQVIIQVDSTTNTCQLNCTLIFDDGQRGLATIGVADFCAALESGLLRELR